MDSISIINESNSIELCADPYQIIINDEYKITLTIIEGKLLELLLNHKTVTRQLCFEQLWEGRVISDPDKSLTQVVSTLRKKFDKVGITKLIVTTPRVGYRISNQWKHVVNSTDISTAKIDDNNKVNDKKCRILLLKNKITLRVFMFFLICLQSMVFFQYFHKSGSNTSSYSLTYLNEEVNSDYRTSRWGRDFFDKTSNKLSFSINNYRVYLSCQGNNKRINTTYSINAFIDNLRNNNNLIDFCSYGS
ncbi:winged helix-turn-helix domain-containing protein [Photobacterium sanguinicancri]|uniref:winged helix-turn-helix domain-containing protein n=1 Tax=Photobacterium sanguinicancri TaxID=875932 RepID=UPI003D0E209C